MELADAKLKKILAESILENRVFKEVNSKNWVTTRSRPFILTRVARGKMDTSKVFIVLSAMHI